MQKLIHDLQRAKSILRSGDSKQLVPVRESSGESTPKA